MNTLSNDQLLYYVTLYRIEPQEMSRPLSGSCGFLRWHAQIINDDQDGSVTTYLVIYQSSRGNANDLWETFDGMQDQANEIAQSIILPSGFHADQHLVAKHAATIVLDRDGNNKGGSLDIIRRLGSLGNNPYLNANDYPLLMEHPHLLQALRYYNAGIYVAELGLFADACMNHVRVVETLFGMYKDKDASKRAYRAACERIQMDFDRVRKLMGVTRNKWAIAHVRDTPDKSATHKTLPTSRIAHECREIAREIIIRYWEHERRIFDASEKGDGYWPLYHNVRFGQVHSFVPTIWLDSEFGSSNLPPPNEVLNIYKRNKGNR